MATIIWHETDLEVEVIHGSATAFSPSGRIDWSETDHICVDDIIVKDRKGREWSIVGRADISEIRRLEDEIAHNAYNSECESRYESMMDAMEARYDY